MKPNPRHLFTVDLPDGRQKPVISRAIYTHALIARNGPAWSVLLWSRDWKQAERRRLAWTQLQLRSGLKPEQYDARVVAVRCNDLPPQRDASALLPDGRLARTCWYPDIGESRPRWLVAAVGKDGWQATAWVAHEADLGFALDRARKSWPKAEPQVVDVLPPKREAAGPG